MKNLAFLILFLIMPLTTHADIKIVEVANGKAVIQFDKEDEISNESVLVKKDLTLGTCKTDNTNSAASAAPVAPTASCPVCKEFSEKPVTLENNSRTHLVGGYFKSFETKIRDEDADSSIKVKTTELDVSYLYNFEKFALGVNYGFERTKQEDNDTLAGSLDLVGRYFFIENKAPNMFIPFVELSLSAIHTSTASPSFTGTLDGDFRGSQIAIGFSYFFNNFGFIDARYGFGSQSGEYELESNSTDASIKTSGIILGFGIAFN